MTYLFSGDGVDGGSAVALICFAFTVLSFFFVFPCFLSPYDDELRTVLASPSNSGFGFCVGFFFYVGTSAEMKVIAGTILCVYWIPFLSFSLCIISLLRGFCFCFGSSFPFSTLYFFGLCFVCSVFLRFSSKIPPSFPGLSLAFIKPEKVWCPCLHKWWASWRREIMTASWV